MQNKASISKAKKEKPFASSVNIKQSKNKSRPKKITPINKKAMQS